MLGKAVLYLTDESAAVQPTEYAASLPLSAQNTRRERRHCAGKVRPRAHGAVLEKSSKWMKAKVYPSLCVFVCLSRSCVCVWEVGADGRGLWIFVAVTVDIVDKFFCHHVLLVSTAWVSELLCVVTHTAVLSTQCNSEKGLLSNSVAFRMLFKRHYSVLCLHCVILKIHKRKITNDIWYELV